MINVLLVTTLFLSFLNIGLNEVVNLKQFMFKINQGDINKIGYKDYSHGASAHRIHSTWRECSSRSLSSCIRAAC